MSAPMMFADGLILPNPEQDRDGVREELNELNVPDDGVDVVRRIEEGNPATEILNIAQLCHADMIVMGSHGRRGLRRWFRGSVAEAVIRKATCPVLTITTQSEAHALRQDPSLVQEVHA
jgi:nucleotide-binding universal stress UspA family protein